MNVRFCWLLLVAFLLLGCGEHPSNSGQPAAPPGSSPPQGNFGPGGFGGRGGFGGDLRRGRPERPQRPDMEE